MFLISRQSFNLLIRINVEASEEEEQSGKNQPQKRQKQQPKSSTTRQMTQEQKKLLKEGGRGRKLSGRPYNVRDLKIDEAQRVLTSQSARQQQAKIPQKRKMGQSKQSAPEEEEEEESEVSEEDEEEEEGEEEEEEGEESEQGEEKEEEEEEKEQEEEEMSPRKKRKLIEQPRSEVLEKMPKKEQEAVLRYYQQASRIGSAKEIEKYLKTRPQSEKQAVKKFVGILHEAGAIGRKAQQTKKGYF